MYLVLMPRRTIHQEDVVTVGFFTLDHSDTVCSETEEGEQRNVVQICARVLVDSDGITATID
jgi:hypothetical protein